MYISVHYIIIFLYSYLKKKTKIKDRLIFRACLCRTQLLFPYILLLFQFLCLINLILSMYFSSLMSLNLFVYFFSFLFSLNLLVFSLNFCLNLLVFFCFSLNSSLNLLVSFCLLSIYLPIYLSISPPFCFAEKTETLMPVEEKNELKRIFCIFFFGLFKVLESRKGGGNIPLLFIYFFLSFF